MFNSVVNSSTLSNPLILANQSYLSLRNANHFVDATTVFFFSHTFFIVNYERKYMINDKIMETGKRKLNENPRQSANLMSILFFGWSIPLFKRTYDKVLDAHDAVQPLEQDRSKILGDRLERYDF